MTHIDEKQGGLFDDLPSSIKPQAEADFPGLKTPGVAGMITPSLVLGADDSVLRDAHQQLGKSIDEMIAILPQEFQDRARQRLPSFPESTSVRVFSLDDAQEKEIGLDFIQANASADLNRGLDSDQEIGAWSRVSVKIAGDDFLVSVVGFFPGVADFDGLLSDWFDRIPSGLWTAERMIHAYADGRFLNFQSGAAYLFESLNSKLQDPSYEGNPEKGLIGKAILSDIATGSHDVVDQGIVYEFFDEALHCLPTDFEACRNSINMALLSLGHSWLESLPEKDSGLWAEPAVFESNRLLASSLLEFLEEAENIASSHLR